MVMTRLIVPGIAVALLAHSASGQTSTQPAAPQSVTPEKETRYLAFQIFTHYSPDPKVAGQLSSGSRERLLPGMAALRAYVEDIKQRIGVIGDRQTRLAVMLGPLCFEQTDAESIRFVDRAFDLALETDVAVGFHIDDSIFWSIRKDLWSDPKNVEALDWDGTPSAGRRLDWSKNPTEAPPQMCFNSEAIQREVQQRSALLGKAIQAGVKRLQVRKKPELFAGVIAGWETMIGQDFKTGKHLGYRALLNRGFSRDHPPKDMDLEREKVVQEFIELWTTGLADAGVSREKIYSHTAFLSRRAFNAGDDKSITSMRKDEGAAYSQHNHFAPPSVAFGEHHRPGFSTYPQPGLFDDIYEQVAKHKQVGWASCEGTNMQPSSGPGQTGMNMETYLAKTFNHGGTVVNIFAWGIGGEAMKNMDFRVVTEGEDALQAYRKFLKGEKLVEAEETSTLMERLPPKMHEIQKGFPIWLQKADADNKDKATALMQQLQEHYKAKKFEEVEKSADAILKLMGVGVDVPLPDDPEEAGGKPETLSLMERLPLKIQKIHKDLPAWVEKTGDKEKATALMQKLDEQLKAENFEQAEKSADSILKMIGVDPAAAAQDIPEEARKTLRHEFGGPFLVTRDKVQGELKLTARQRERLEQRLRELIPDLMQSLQKFEGMKPEKRSNEFGADRQRAREKLAAVLKETLDEAQAKRLRELVLRREGLFGDGESWTDLKLAVEQRKRFMAEIQQMQKKIAPLMEEARKSGNPDEIRPKVLKLREDLQGKLEALLTGDQRKQWKEMLGEPVDVSLLFDDVSPR